MKNKQRSNTGITLVSLTKTIIVLIIIASISIYSGRGIIKEAKLEELRTNMLLIQAKAKEYVEQANFKIGQTQDESTKATIREEVYVTGAGLTKAQDAGITVPSAITLTENFYVVTSTALQNWGLGDIQLEEDEYYLIEFNDTDATVEIYNTLGFTDNETIKYSLTEIDAIEL